MPTDLRDLRIQIIQASAVSGEGHVPSALSVLDLLYVLYHRVLHVDPQNPDDPSRDFFILSKGHASLGLYAILAERGFFSPSELERFARYDSILGGHPDHNKVPGVEASTGSLGHGLPVGVGIALGLKIQRSNRRVFVMVGDGECNEGTIWESALLAAHHDLSNLCCVVDYNHSTDRALRVGDLVQKFQAFGWDACAIPGHDHDAIFQALSASSSRPRAVIANTIKGKGCTMMENQPAWHHRAPRPEELPEILASVPHA